jgi:hypothetical protein
MPVQPADLMLLQQSGTQYKVSAATLKAFMQADAGLPIASTSVLGGIKVGQNLSITGDGVLSAEVPGALVYMGTKDFTAAPGSLNQQVGHLYVNTTNGTANAGWIGFGGETVNIGDMAIWNGSTWDLNASGSGEQGVLTVSSTAPIVTGGTATNPSLSITAATPSSSGVGGSAGSLSAVDKEKLDGIASGAAPGTVTNVSGTAPIDVVNGGTTPSISIDNGTTQAVGAVRLADDAAVQSGVAGRVVQASQLKTTNDAIASIDVGVTEVTGSDPVVVTGTTSSKQIAVKDGSTTQKGVAQFATASQTAWDFVSPSSTLVVTPAGIRANYMPLNIDLLDELP